MCCGSEQQGILYTCDGQVFCVVVAYNKGIFLSVTVVAANKKVFNIIVTDKYFEYKGTMRCVLSYYFRPIVFYVLRTSCMKVLCV